VTTHAPTARQVEVAEAARLHGSAAAAATHLGVSRQTVETTLARYHLDVCDARIDELQHEVERLRELADVGRMAGDLARAAAAMGQARPPVSHRRIADGGTHVKDQRRRARDIDR
jgi:hypothetical protein